MIRALAPRLGRDRKGSAAVEFALVAPVMLLGMMGLFDLGYTMYTSAVLQGAIQKAARDSTIEGAADKTAALDARVKEVVDDVAPKATLAYKRTKYTNFSDVREPEEYTDVDGNGTCDGGEPFEDVNGNGTWDQDRGADGLGGARDAVLYEVTVTYPRPFPFAKFIGQSGYFSMTSATVLRNQPYGLQGTSIATGNCT